MEKTLKQSFSPHVRGNVTARSIMLDVIIALSPALIWGVYAFGARAAVITLLSVGASVGSEALFCLITKRKQTVGDLSAVVTGLILAFGLPVTVPLWAPVLGGAFAAVVVKMLFGGIGKNFLNPALAARVFLTVSFPAMMSGSFVTPRAARALSPFALKVSAAFTPTVLDNVEEGVDSNTLVDLFYGNTAGCIGEVSKICLIIGLVYLLLRRVVSWHIPAAYIAAFFLLTYLFPRGEDEAINFALASLLSGGVFFAAFFMATDYTTSPISSLGKLIYGALCGALTVFFRYFGGYAEGAVFAVLIMNLFAGHIDRLTMPKVFGGGVNAKKQ